MLYSCLPDDLESLEDLPSGKGFLMLSHNGFVQSVKRDVPLLIAIKNHLQHRCSMAHCILRDDVIIAGAQSFQDLQSRLIDEVLPGLTTYAAIIAAQGVIVRHYQEAIANLVEQLDACDHQANLRVFSQITDNSRILAKFRPHYQEQAIEWERKTQSYQRAFCSEPESVSVTLR